MSQLTCGPFGAVEDQGQFYARTFVSLHNDWLKSEQGEDILQGAERKIKRAQELHQLHSGIKLSRFDDDTILVELRCEDMAHAKGEAKRMQENLANLLNATQRGDPLVIREQRKGFSHIMVAAILEPEIAEDQHIVKMAIRLQGDWINTVEGHDALERADAVLYKARHVGALPAELTTEVKSNELIVRVYCHSSANAIKQEELLKKAIPEILHCGYADKSQSSRRGA